MARSFKRFNSIKVRLELAFFTIDERSGRFQFHKGTIRTMPGEMLALQLKEFQFHKGTIRTLSGATITWIAPFVSIP